jgi:hypothetical protein
VKRRRLLVILAGVVLAVLIAVAPVAVVIALLL